MTQEPNFKTLKQLKDTNIGTLSLNQVLKWNGSKWVNGSSSSSSEVAYEFSGLDCTGSNPNKSLDVGVVSVNKVFIETGFVHPSQYSQIGTVITFNNIIILDVFKITVYA